MLKISDSHIVEVMNVGNSAMTKMKGLMESKNTITPRNCVELDFLVSTRSRELIDAAGIARALASGRLKIVYERTVSIGKAIPFIPYGSGQTSGIIINGTVFFNESEVGTVDGTKTKVYSSANGDASSIAELLNMAQVILGGAVNPTLGYNNIRARKEFLGLYVEMFSEVMSRLTTVSTNPEVFTIAKWMVGTFFFARFGIKDITTAAKFVATFVDLDQSKMAVHLSTIPKEAWEDFSVLLSVMAGKFMQLKDLDVSSVIYQYTVLFNAMSPIAVDYPPYFLGLVASGLTGCTITGRGFKKKYNKYLTVGSGLVANTYNSVF